MWFRNTSFNNNKLLKQQDPHRHGEYLEELDLLNKALKDHRNETEETLNQHAKTAPESKLNREIETKLLVSGTTLETVNQLMAHLLASRKTKQVFGYSRDTYWGLGPKKFLRARERDGIVQVTVKQEDQSDAVDRLEIDLNVTSPIDQVLEALRVVHGAELGVIEKTYYVYWVGPTKQDTVCCYQATVDGQVKSDIVIEVECSTRERMQELVDEVTEYYRKGLNIRVAEGSLYTMYLLPQEEKPLTCHEYSGKEPPSAYELYPSLDGTVRRWPGGNIVTWEK